jgi:hypothetical protein
VYPGPIWPTAVHDVALKQLIALRSLPEGVGTVDLFQFGAPLQVWTRFAPPELPTAVQKFVPAHDTELKVLFVGGEFAGIFPVHEDPFH